MANFGVVSGLMLALGVLAEVVVLPGCEAVELVVELLVVPLDVGLLLEEPHAARNATAQQASASAEKRFVIGALTLA
ncbi:MAG TPA: hypothetical protein VMD79_02550 [Solirubrobacteraceae bacterium]|nr:hypothetical protein [Solirubrobacteraceae bacterium]